MKTETREKKLAALWLKSVHCTSAIHNLAWRSAISPAIREALDLVSSVDGVRDEIAARVDAERQRLAKKGYNLPA